MSWQWQARENDRSHAVSSRPRRLPASLLSLAAVALMAGGSVAASFDHASEPGSHCPPRATASAGGALPVGCPARAGQPLSQALGFGAVVGATAWCAQRRRR